LQNCLVQSVGMRDWVSTWSWNEIDKNVIEFRTLMLKYHNKQKYETLIHHTVEYSHFVFKWVYLKHAIQINDDEKYTSQQ